MTSPPTPERQYWLDEPRNIKRIVYALVVVCVGLVVSDFFYDKHVHYAIEKIPGFHGVYGYVGAIFLVMSAKGLRKLVMRDEDYYDR